MSSDGHSDDSSSACAGPSNLVSSISGESSRASNFNLGNSNVGSSQWPGLKVPTLSDISRKRKTKSNHYKHARKEASASDPKDVSPSDRMQKFPNEDKVC